MLNNQNTSIKNTLAFNLLKDIMEKVLICCERMHYECLLKSKKIDNNENKIRNHLHINYLNNDKIRKEIGLDKYLFQTEVETNYVDDKPLSRMDFKVCCSDIFQNSSSFFIIECKRLDGNNYLNREYVVEGVNRFLGVSPAYSSLSKISSMLGFIVSNIDIDDNLKNICNIQKDCCENPNDMKKISDNIYFCRYGNNNIITLFHVFYDFSDIIM